MILRRGNTAGELEGKLVKAYDHSNGSRGKMDGRRFSGKIGEGGSWYRERPVNKNGVEKPGMQGEKNAKYL